MELKVDTLKCIGCRVCEFACSFHYDREFTAISASLMLHREERKNYFGLIVKRDKDLLLARPEGQELMIPGEKMEGGGASSKPILMRSPCDLCEEEEGEPFCIRVCPTQCLSVGD